MNSMGYLPAGCLVEVKAFRVMSRGRPGVENLPRTGFDRMRSNSWRQCWLQYRSLRRKPQPRYPGRL